MTDLYSLIDEIKEEFPDFELKSKSSSGFMKFLNVCLLIITAGQMKTFMDKFTTTIGYTVYTPEEWILWGHVRQAGILNHERVHLRQRKDKGSFWFSLSYLLLPCPCVWAYYRMKYEMEAYEVTMAGAYELHGSAVLRDAAFRDSMIQNFTGASYFWTWPWRKRIERWYDETADRLER